MTTLYVVTRPCHVNDEDGPRHVERIFSTRAKAEEWVGPAAENHTMSVGDYLIEERTLDDIGPERPTLLYHASIRVNSGEMFGMPGEDRTSVVMMPVGFQSEFGISFIGFQEYTAIDARSSVSAAHALEVAERERERCLASGGRAAG